MCWLGMVEERRSLESVQGVTGLCRTFKFGLMASGYLDQRKLHSDEAFADEFLIQMLGYLTINAIDYETRCSKPAPLEIILLSSGIENE